MLLLAELSNGDIGAGGLKSSSRLSNGDISAGLKSSSRLSNGDNSAGLKSSSRLSNGDLKRELFYVGNSTTSELRADNFMRAAFTHVECVKIVLLSIIFIMIL